MAIVDQLNEKYSLDRSVQIVAVTCVTTSPFTVYLAGGSDAVPGRIMAGSSFSSGDNGLAIWQSPMPPICFKAS